MSRFLRSPNPFFLAFLFCAFGVTPKVAASESVELPDERPFSAPLLLRNDCPLYLTFFSTAFPDRPGTTSAHQWAWEFGYLSSNYIIEQHNVTESDRIVVDDEIERFEFSLRYGLRDDLEIAVTVPYLAMGGGYMDDFIQSFEDTFGFTTPGARESRKSNDFQYLFRVDGNDLISKSDESISGFADIPIQLKYRFRNQTDGWFPYAAVRGILKVPSASGPLLGNERFDGGFGLLAEQPIGGRIRLLTNIDVTSTHLPTALKTVDIDPVMVSGSVGFEHFLTNRASWRAQMTMATNPYPKFHQDISALNHIPMGIGVGWVYRFSKRAAVKLTVGENFYSAWPDFAWSASLQKEF